jgi:hypothetical protein
MAVQRWGTRAQVDDPWVEYVDEFGRTRTCRQSELPAACVAAPADVRTVYTHTHTHTLKGLGGVAQGTNCARQHGQPAARVRA